MSTESFEKSYFKLLSSYQKKSLFLLPTSTWVSEIVFCFIFFWFGFFLYEKSVLLAYMAQLISCVHMVWLIHDLGHGAIVKDSKLSQLLAETLGVFYLGMPQIEYHFKVHRIHHAFTNILGKDLALETGPIVWHKSKLAKTKSYFLKKQVFIWHFIILPLTYPLLTLQLMADLFIKKKVFRLVFILLRWVVMFILFFDRLDLLFIPPLIAGFILGYAASLNHFHLDIWEDKTLTTKKDIFQVTQNIDKDGKVFSWLVGGLNFHIEHHLFPNMPSRNLRLIRNDVKMLAHDHHLPYRSEKLFNCSILLWRNLRSFGYERPI